MHIIKSNSLKSVLPEISEFVPKSNFVPLILKSTKCQVPDDTHSQYPSKGKTVITNEVL